MFYECFQATLRNYMVFHDDRILRRSEKNATFETNNYRDYRMSNYREKCDKKRDNCSENRMTTTSIEYLFR